MWAFPPRLFSLDQFCLFLAARSVHSFRANATLISTFPQTPCYSQQYWDWQFRRVIHQGMLGARKLLRKLQLTLKSVFDLALSLLGLIVLTPVFALIALYISLDSPGEIFFKLRVAGREGKPFNQWKL